MPRDALRCASPRSSWRGRRRSPGGSRRAAWAAPAGSRCLARAEDCRPVRRGSSPAARPRRRPTSSRPRPPGVISTPSSRRGASCWLLMRRRPVTMRNSGVARLTTLAHAPPRSRTERSSTIGTPRSIDEAQPGFDAALSLPRERQGVRCRGRTQSGLRGVVAERAIQRIRRRGAGHSQQTGDSDSGHLHRRVRADYSARVRGPENGAMSRAASSNTARLPSLLPSLNERHAIALVLKRPRRVVLGPFAVLATADSRRRPARWPGVADAGRRPCWHRNQRVELHVAGAAVDGTVYVRRSLGERRSSRVGHHLTAPALVRQLTSRHDNSHLARVDMPPVIVTGEKGDM